MPPTFFSPKTLRPWLALSILAGVAIVIALLPIELQTLLRYERAAIGDGQLWRLLTGHFVHTGFNHLMMNVVALALIILLFQQQIGTRYIVLQSTFIALLISLALYFFHSNLVWYVGLSGVLHGIFSGESVRLIRQGDKIGWLMLAACVAKIASEQIMPNNGTTAALIGAPVITEAHAWGAIAGFTSALSYDLLRSIKERLAVSRR